MPYDYICPVCGERYYSASPKWSLYPFARLCSHCGVEMEEVKPDVPPTRTFGFSAN